MKAPLDLEQLEWIEMQGRRMERVVAKGFEKAVDRACPLTAQEADERRRAIARQIDAPRFPAEWGDPLIKCWLANGKLSPTRPNNSPSLTVWRWADFEVTATFDLWRVYGRRGEGDEFGAWGLTYTKNRPPGEGWEEAGPTDNYSTLWARPLKAWARPLKGGAK